MVWKLVCSNCSTPHRRVGVALDQRSTRRLASPDEAENSDATYEFFLIARVEPTKRVMARMGSVSN